MNALLRPINIDEHPVAKKRYRIPTPAIEQFYSLVQRHCQAYPECAAIVAWIIQQHQIIEVTVSWQRLSADAYGYIFAFL